MFVIRLPSRSLGEGWCFVIRLASIVVSELPKTATDKVQKYVLRGQARDFEAVTGLSR